MKNTVLMQAMADMASPIYEWVEQQKRLGASAILTVCGDVVSLEVKRAVVRNGQPGFESLTVYATHREVASAEAVQVFRRTMTARVEAVMVKLRAES